MNGSSSSLTIRLVGTTFYPVNGKRGNQKLENWLATQVNPRVDFNIFEFTYSGDHFAVFRLEATRNTPVAFRGEPYIRIGSYKKPLDEHPQRERKIWNAADRFVFERELALQGATEDEILKLIDYPSFFELLKFPLPDNRKGIIDRLDYALFCQLINLIIRPLVFYNNPMKPEGKFFLLTGETPFFRQS